jgi:ArsR family transcriptional regulator, arsenate/arsenite/antimonite-responsive transcriptional repressor
LTVGRYFHTYRNVKQKDALTALSALAQDTRLEVFRFLVTAGPQGASAGDIARAVKVPAPTLSFHLKELEQARLILSRRESRSIIYSANYSHMRGLLVFLMEDCCSGRSDICDINTKRKECAP